MRVLYDLLMYWAAALLAVLVAKPIRLPPLLFYLIFGGNSPNAASRTPGR